MQFVDGPTLIRELKQKGPWSEVETALLAAAVCDALDYSHRRGIVHRDIKPENILVDMRAPPLPDGLRHREVGAERRAHPHGDDPRLARLHRARAADGRTRVDGRADIYSLGATLYRMVSNSFPFQDSDAVRMAMKRFTMAPEPLGPKRPGIDPVFDAIVMKSLEREPAARFQTAGEMGQALEDFLAGDPVPLPPPEKFGRPPEPGGTPDGRSLPSGGTPSGLSAPVPPSVDFPAGVVLSASVPTVRTAPAASVPSPPPARSRSRILWIAAAVGLPALGAFLATRTSHVAPFAPAATAPGPTVSSLLPTAPPATPVPLPTAAPEPTPAGAPRRRPLPPPRSGPRPNHPPAPRPRADAPPPEPAASSRRPATPAQSESGPAIELSPELLREFANRSVGLRVTIAEDGTVKDARVISPLCPECDRAARAAILRYRFKPARDSEGRPVESTVGVPVIIPGPENP